MLNYRVAKMVNLMPWACTRALMTEFKDHMHYEEMVNSDIVLKSKIDEVERQYQKELGVNNTVKRYKNMSIQDAVKVANEPMKN